MNNVKLERLKHNLLQKDLAEYLKINIGTYRKKENNPLEFTVREIKLLSKKYGCSTDRLLEGIEV